MSADNAVITESLLKSLDQLAADLGIAGL